MARYFIKQRTRLQDLVFFILQGGLRKKLNSAASELPCMLHQVLLGWDRRGM